MANKKNVGIGMAVLAAGAGAAAVAVKNHKKTEAATAKKKKAAAEPVVFEPEDCQKEEANPTVFLGSETPCVIGELRYEGMGEEKNIKITKSLFLVGSLEDQADGIISADTVSRIHARITKEGEDYYLEDMNSTNGTSRNGTPLHYKEKVKLEKNDKILFAKERYRFV